MHRLRESAHDQVRPLFATMYYNLAVQAILEGSLRADIYVDDPVHPRVAVTRHRARLFLAGSPDSQAFNEHLRHSLAARAAREDLFVLYYEPAPAWENTLDALLGDLDPIRAGREYYTLELPASGAHAVLPEGFSLRYVDEELLADEKLGNRDELVEELCSERQSVQDFLERSFGACLLHGDDVAGWCLSEYNSADRCEVGIATFGPHRRQGLATATGSALLNLAASRGITQVGWHCYASNIASAATARKLGFTRTLEYPVRFAYLDRAINSGVHGNVAFEQGEYELAVSRYREAIGNGDAPLWVFWNVACACALLGRRTAALSYLGQAIDHGFDDLERLLASEHLTSLHHTEEWKTLSQRLQR